MTVQWYKGRRGSTIPKEGCYVRISKLYFQFTDEVWKECFGGLPFLQFGYDETENAIYILPHTTRPENLLVFKIGTVTRTHLNQVTWDNFLKEFKLFFEKSSVVKCVEANGKSRKIVLAKQQ